MNTDNKTYILQKDLPDAKAGTELIFDGENCYDYNSDRTDTTDNVTISWYKKHFVENNPEWFKLKQQPVEDKRIVISELSRANTFGENGFRYDFYTDKNIPQERYEAVKQAIERELNNEKPFSYDVKVSVPDVGEIKDLGVELFKLKRDNEALKSINKQFTEHIEYLNSVIEKKDVKVSNPIMERQEVKEKYISQDGVKMYKGDDEWIVDEDFKLIHLLVSEIANEDWFKDNKVFSTKEKAEEYILMNEPCLSLNDVISEIKSICDGSFSDDTSRWNWVLSSNLSPNALIRKIKYKINKQ